MKRVLLVGLDPATVDFSDPALPPGMTAEKIQAGINFALTDMTGRGYLAENCSINPDETAVPTVERRLAGDDYDCVVIGAGRRQQPSPSTAVLRTPGRRRRDGSEILGELAYRMPGERL